MVGEWSKCSGNRKVSGSRLAGNFFKIFPENAEKVHFSQNEKINPEINVGLIS